MLLSEFKEGLDIISRHYNKLDDFHINAEHDQIYLQETDTPVSEEEFLRLRELGWFQPDVFSKLGKEQYDPNEMWSAFV